jgi:hypothetical protein
MTSANRKPARGQDLLRLGRTAQGLQEVSKLNPPRLPDVRRAAPGNSISSSTTFAALSALSESGSIKTIK